MAVKILVVEHNAVARAFLTRVVKESFSDDLEISQAADLESALGLLGASAQVQPGKPALQEPWRLILVDLELPHRSAMELLSALRHSPAIKIVTTLYSDDDHLFPALQYGASGYLLKEDRFEVLVEGLQKIVRGQPPLSPAIARRLLSQFRRHEADAALTTAPGVLGVIGPSSGQGPLVENERLTTRESEVLTYLSKGFTVKEIAGLMGLKWHNINDHIVAIYKKISAQKI